MSDSESPAPAPATSAGSITEDQVKLALRRVKDPELNLNILDLGLIYEIKVDGSDVSVDMSLTSPGCPSAAPLAAHNPTTSPTEKPPRTFLHLPDPAPRGRRFPTPVKRAFPRHRGELPAAPRPKWVHLDRLR